MTSYLIKSILCSGILIVVYKLFLEREKMFVFNRLYLLLAIIFSLAVPSISFKIDKNVYQEPVIAETPAKLAAVQHAFVTSTMDQTVQSSMPHDFSIYIPYIFWSITGILFVRFARNVWVIFRLKSKCRTVPVSSATLVLVPQEIITFTFLDNIFVPEKTFENKQIKQEILTHELAHANQLHTIDILFIELVQALMWFNPFLFFYKRAIRLNHEFLADEAVISIYGDAKSYQLLLLDTILHSRQVVLTSSFNYSITKQRLAMMTKSKNLKSQLIKQSAIALLAFTLTFAFSKKIYSQVKQPDTGASKTANTLSKKNTGSGLSESEVDAFYETINKHIVYRKNNRGQIYPDVDMPAKEADQIYALYSRMDAGQQKAVKDSNYTIFQMPIPVKKAPSPEIFENWKNPAIFGIWINEKHVPNTELNKYKNTDIAESYLSKLYGAARKGRSYKYQLDLMTNEYFDKTYESRLANRVLIGRWIALDKKPKKSGK